MNLIVTRRGMLGCAMVLATAFGSGATARAQDQSVKAGDLVISQAWTRATPGGAKVGGGYLTIENKGATADRLIGGATPAAARFEIHEMSMSDGVMKMHPVAGGLTIAPGKTVKLAPGGYHLMMIDLKQPFKQGETVPVTLRFDGGIGRSRIGACHPATGRGGGGQLRASHLHRAAWLRRQRHQGAARQIA